MAQTNFRRFVRRVVCRGGFLIPKGAETTSDADITRASLLVSTLRHAQCVSIANQSLAAGALPTIDGYVVQEGDRVLLAAQVTPSQNGPWIASAAGWTRPNDFPSGLSVTSRSMKVTGGTLFGGTDWFLSSTAPVVIDAGNQTWKAIAATASLTVLPLTAGSSWGVVAGFRAPAYARIGQLVKLAGSAKNTVAGDTTIATLPAGFRPSASEFWRCSASPGQIDVTVHADGTITIGGGPYGYVSLDPISFVAEA